MRWRGRPKLRAQASCELRFRLRAAVRSACCAVACEPRASKSRSLTKSQGMCRGLRSRASSSSSPGFCPLWAAPVICYTTTAAAPGTLPSRSRTSVSSPHYILAQSALPAAWHCALSRTGTGTGTGTTYPYPTPPGTELTPSESPRRTAFPKCITPHSHVCCFQTEANNQCWLSQLTARPPSRGAGRQFGVA